MYTPAPIEYSDLTTLAAAIAGQRVVAIDGFSGSGKTTLARDLATRTGRQIVAIEDFVPGWHGLAAGVGRVASNLLEPYAQGQIGTLRIYDWWQRAWGKGFSLPADKPLIVEGCGAGAIPPELIGALVWLEAPAKLRQDRLAGRSDHELYLPHRSVWHLQELALISRARTRWRADYIVDVSR